MTKVIKCENVSVSLNNNLTTKYLFAVQQPLTLKGVEDYSLTFVTNNDNDFRYVTEEYDKEEIILDMNQTHYWKLSGCTVSGYDVSYNPDGSISASIDLKVGSYYPDFIHTFTTRDNKEIKTRYNVYTKVKDTYGDPCDMTADEYESRETAILL